jgi:hypothetical protein
VPTARGNMENRHLPGCTGRLHVTAALTHSQGVSLHTFCIRCLLVYNGAHRSIGKEPELWVGSSPEDIYLVRSSFC